MEASEPFLLCEDKRESTKLNKGRILKLPVEIPFMAMV